MSRAAWSALLAASSLALVACGGSEPLEDTSEIETTSGAEQPTSDNTNAPAPEPAVPSSAAGPVGYPGRSGTGASPEDPVSACGPQDSYAFLASEFQCPGGGNPLGGDPAQGASARVGNVGANSTGHIIDHYQVPCPGGPVDVYVDMYGCPQMEEMLRSFGGGA